MSCMSVAHGGDALAIAAAIRKGQASAEAVAQDALDAIGRVDARVHAFSAVTRERALAEARAIDARYAAGETLPPLAGVPYAVKDLFDVAGVTTLAGSKMLADDPPARTDAVLVARMRAAGAVLVGTLAMDEFAYGFTTENSHRGPVRNPHDPARIAGGSSGGCGAAVAARMVPLALGSDTNGSIRVPSSLCGIWGLKPTFGRLSRRGSYPFVASLDHLGPFAATLAGLAACYDALQGPDADDPACARRPPDPVGAPRADTLDGVRVARLGGWFEERTTPVARAAVDRACAVLGVVRRLDWADAALARATAFVVTASEGGALHLPDLRARYADLEPLSRDRLAAGSLVPAAWYLQAQRLRAAMRERARRLFADADVLIAPATPCAATPIGETTLALGAERLPLRPSMGLLTQPLSSIGLPVLAAPIPDADGALPIAVQLVAAPWREDLCFRVAAALEAAGVAVSPRPPIRA